jgi:hypothetical protein
MPELAVQTPVVVPVDVLDGREFQIVLLLSTTSHCARNVSVAFWSAGL